MCMIEEWLMMKNFLENILWTRHSSRIFSKEMGWLDCYGVGGGGSVWGGLRENNRFHDLKVWICPKSEIWTLTTNRSNWSCLCISFRAHSVWQRCPNCMPSSFVLIGNACCALRRHGGSLFSMSASQCRGAGLNEWMSAGSELRMSLTKSLSYYLIRGTY